MQHFTRYEQISKLQLFSDTLMEMEYTSIIGGNHRGDWSAPNFLAGKVTVFVSTIWKAFNPSS